MPKSLCHSDTSPCPLAHALDIIGDRWTLLIIRDLLLRNLHEYKELLNSFEGISTNILADRLRRLTAAGLIRVAAHPRSRTRKLYYLTSAGKGLIHVMIEMATWSGEHLGTAMLPAEIASRLAKDRDAYILEVLGELERWEKRYLS